MAKWKFIYEAIFSRKHVKKRLYLQIRFSNMELFLVDGIENMILKDNFT